MAKRRTTQQERRDMVAAVRRGNAQRAVARAHGVSLSTIQFWVARAGDRRLDRVDWGDHPSGLHPPPWRTSTAMEELVLALRRDLHQSDLGEFGAAAIHRELVAAEVSHPPCIRTIGRILKRCGAVERRRRVRRQPPPRGWYLPDLAAKSAELDQFDIIEGLVIKDGPRVEILTSVSVHSRLVAAWPRDGLSARQARTCLLEHWRAWGLPAYAQFDNDTIFQGPHQHADTVGSVSRLCLSLGVVPVFAPPREMGFQGIIENFNGRWQAKVWTRFQHESLAALEDRSDRYISAHRRRTVAFWEAAPNRRRFPSDWHLDLQAHPGGRMVFLRRTTDQGDVSLLGHTFTVDPNWPNRLVRCEVELTTGVIRIHSLRRREPNIQPLLREIPYTLSCRRFRE